MSLDSLTNEQESRRVLIIEDDDEVARLICMSLQKNGLVCRTANEGNLGLRMFEEFKPHLVLLDLMLPGMSGVEILGALRVQGDVPVIIVSALADDENTPLPEGANAIVGKPFSPMRLYRAVQDQLKQAYGV